MADIWLMRHAAYEGHHPGHHAPPDASLSAEGRVQVRRAFPLPPSITAIVTSPLLRASETADLLSQLTGIPVIDTTPLLAEWRAPSMVIGHTPDTYPPEYRAWREHRATNPSLACGDGESLAELYDRASRCAEYLAEVCRGRNGDVLALSHNVLLSALTCLNTRSQNPEAAFRRECLFAHVMNAAGRS
ncbi:histidine phosphatase family protein [Streptomyces sp. NPDC087270]|uniref:histidine phosphatase family protein n=1 Tax=Streptomyces sp. NPDC087270 TaxID=3365774 RepID=UPI0037F1BBD4